MDPNSSEDECELEDVPLSQQEEEEEGFEVDDATLKALLGVKDDLLADDLLSSDDLSPEEDAALELLSVERERGREDVIGDMLTMVMLSSALAQTQVIVRKRECFVLDETAQSMFSVPSYVMAARYPMAQWTYLKDKFAIFKTGSAVYSMSPNAIYLPRESLWTVDARDVTKEVPLRDPRNFYVYSMLRFVVQCDQQASCNSRYAVGVKDGNPVCLFLVVFGNSEPVPTARPFIVRRR